MFLGMDQHIYFEDRPCHVDSLNLEHTQGDNLNKDLLDTQANMNKYHCYIWHWNHKAMESMDHQIQVLL